MFPVIQSPGSHHSMELCPHRDLRADAGPGAPVPSASRRAASVSPGARAVATSPASWSTPSRRRRRRGRGIDVRQSLFSSTVSAGEHRSAESIPRPAPLEARGGRARQRCHAQLRVGRGAQRKGDGGPTLPALVRTT